MIRCVEKYDHVTNNCDIALNSSKRLSTIRLEGNIIINLSVMCYNPSSKMLSVTTKKFNEDVPIATDIKVISLPFGLGPDWKPTRQNHRFGKQEQRL